MTMLGTCGADGCTTKTLGELCLEHETARRFEPSPSFDFKRAQPRRGMRSIPAPGTLSPTGERSR